MGDLSTGSKFDLANEVNGRLQQYDAHYRHYAEGQVAQFLEKVMAS